MAAATLLKLSSRDSAAPLPWSRWPRRCRKVLILRPDGALQLQRQCQSGPVSRIADAIERLVPGRFDPGAVDDLHHLHQAEEGLLADLRIKASTGCQFADVTRGLRGIGRCHEEIHLTGGIGNQSAHPDPETAADEDVGIKHQPFAFCHQA